MRRIVMVVMVAVVLVVAVTAASFAGSGRPVRWEGRAANAYWTQVDGPPAADPADQPFGNVHLGWLDAWESTPGSADVFVYIDDFRCPDGKLPGGHEGHEGHEEPAEEACEHVGSRFGEGYGLTLTADRKLSKARLTGQIEMTQGGGHGEPGEVVGRPQADITWSGTGATWRSVGTWRTHSGGSFWFDRYRQTSREATMSGTLGSMGFDPNLSGGNLSVYSSMYKSR